MRTSKYVAAVLAPLARESRTMAELLRKLGLEPTGGNYRHIARRLRAENVDIGHFKKASLSHISDERIRELAARCRSVAQMLTELGFPTDGRPHHSLTERVKRLELDVSHFRGRGWSRGLTRREHPAIDRVTRKLSHPDEIVFTENSPVTLHGAKMKARLLALGWEYRCNWCGISEWRERSLVLHLDHINGINNDNRLENLRFLCPNCHSQTDTYCRRLRHVPPGSRAKEAAGGLEHYARRSQSPTDSRSCNDHTDLRVVVFPSPPACSPLITRVVAVAWQ